MRKLTGSYPELQFKLQLARSALSVNSVPTYDSIEKYAEHLTAELEQVNHRSKKKENLPPEPLKLKRFEEQNPRREKRDWEEKNEREEKEKEKEKLKRRFYLTDQGCRRGKSCGFPHEI